MSNKQVAVITEGNDILTQGDFEFYSTTPHGIVFKEDISQEEWVKVTQRIVESFESTHGQHCKSLFLLGDALRFGEDKFGEVYAQAIDATRGVMRLKMKTVENAAWIASKVPAELRRETLSLTHHELVAPLEAEEQAELLEKADDEGMSTGDLKALIRERHPKPKAKAKKNGATEPEEDEVSEEDALAALEKVLIYFAAAEKETPFKEWGKQRLGKWKQGLHDIAIIARRAVIDKRSAAKKKG